MNIKFAALAGLTVLATLGSASTAQAGNEAGSLLVFPEFNNRYGVANALTVTNTNSDVSVIGTSGGSSSSGSNLILAGTVDVEFVYVNKQNCEEFNRTERLTPNDTLTVLTRFHNPEQLEGYVYAFAKDPMQGNAIAFDWLIGSNLIIEGGLGQFQYSTNPFVYKAGEGLSDGDATDLDGDGLRDLNGAEYEESPDKILVPRFLGQDVSRAREGKLILINLSGGASFDALIDLIIYNDNEEPFSAQHDFNCWDKVDLLDISNAFKNSFLLDSTNHAYNEIMGAPYIKAGWFKMDGRVANSMAVSIQDPAFLAVYIESVGPYAAADLPFTQGSQDNGDLIPFGPEGDVIN